MSEHVKVSLPQKKDNSPSTSNQSKQTPLMSRSHPAAITQRAMISPQSLTDADVMQLQRTIGNRAVSQLMREIGMINSKPVQRKEAELENDMRLASSAVPVQRMDLPEEEQEKEPSVQGKFEAMQREEMREEEEPVQMKTVNKTGMTDQLKAGVENLSGIDMGDVRVHYNSDKPAGIGALAYTQGTDIHVAPGQEKHLTHEAWHVVQQAQGRVRPTMQLKGVEVNDDAGLEQEASDIGRVLQKSNNPINNPAQKCINPVTKVLQAVWERVRDSSEPDAVYYWDIDMDGVRWFSDGNVLWYKIRTQGSEDYSTLQGEKKTFADWHRLRWEAHKEEYILPFEVFSKEKDSDQQKKIIMADIIQKAESHIPFLRQFKNQPEFLAARCTSIMEVLNDEAMQRMEGRNTRIKTKPISRAPLVRTEVAKTTSLLAGELNEIKRYECISNLSALLIASQFFTEGNNRGTYIMMVLLGGIFDTRIPSVDKALTRNKDEAGFNPKKIKQQFIAMMNPPPQ